MYCEWFASSFNKWEGFIFVSLFIYLMGILLAMFRRWCEVVGIFSFFFFFFFRNNLQTRHYNGFLEELPQRSPQAVEIKDTVNLFIIWSTLKSVSWR